MNVGRATAAAACWRSASSSASAAPTTTAPAATSRRWLHASAAALRWICAAAPDFVLPDGVRLRRPTD